jgi:hypothetical protein
MIINKKLLIVSTFSSTYYLPLSSEDRILRGKFSSFISLSFEEIGNILTAVDPLF